MALKSLPEDFNRNKRAQKNAKFAGKKILLTRRAILDRIVSMCLILRLLISLKENKLDIKLLFI